MRSVTPSAEAGAYFYGSVQVEVEVEVEVEDFYNFIRSKLSEAGKESE